ncbi:MAG: ribosome maturation factor RimP [Lachnospiraceae bacterium]
MAKHEFVEQKTEELIAPIIEAHHFELVDVEYVKEGSMKYLRVYIDKEGGITVDDCEVISREFNDILDREDYVDEAYVFEVSSPGLGRPLKKDKDFARSLGDEVEVRLFKALNKKKEYTGILKSYDEQTVTITTEDEEDVVFERASIALIRLAFDF